MDIKIFSAIIVVLILGMVIELARREKLSFKYAAGWLTVSVAGVFFIIFDDFLGNIAHWFGFQLTSNFIFFVLLGLFILLSLLLTTFLCQQNNRNDLMAQKIGILELEIARLKEKLQGK
ncbi:MAG: DUF2304 domain-containing protein [Candidatus Omnitrophota bacterium]